MNLGATRTRESPWGKNGKGPRRTAEAAPMREKQVVGSKGVTEPRGGEWVQRPERAGERLLVVPGGAGSWVTLARSAKCGKRPRIPVQ